MVKVTKVLPRPGKCPISIPITSRALSKIDPAATPGEVPGYVQPESIMRLQEQFSSVSDIPTDYGGSYDATVQQSPIDVNWMENQELAQPENTQATDVRGKNEVDQFYFKEVPAALASKVMLGPQTSQKMLPSPLTLESQLSPEQKQELLDFMVKDQTSGVGDVLGGQPMEEIPSMTRGSDGVRMYAVSTPNDVQMKEVPGSDVVGQVKSWPNPEPMSLRQATAVVRGTSSDVGDVLGGQHVHVAREAGGSEFPVTPYDNQDDGDPTEQIRYFDEEMALPENTQKTVAAGDDLQTPSDVEWIENKDPEQPENNMAQPQATAGDDLQPNEIQGENGEDRFYFTEMPAALASKIMLGPQTSQKMLPSPLTPESQLSPEQKQDLLDFMVKDKTSGVGDVLRGQPVEEIPSMATYAPTTPNDVQVEKVIGSEIVGRVDGSSTPQSKQFHQHTHGVNGTSTTSQYDGRGTDDKGDRNGDFVLLSVPFAIELWKLWRNRRRRKMMKIQMMRSRTTTSPTTMIPYLSTQNNKC